MNKSIFAIVVFIVVLVVFIAIFLLLREFWCWYWKISALEEEATYTNDLLEKILKELKKQNSNYSPEEELKQNTDKSQESGYNIQNNDFIKE